MSVEQITGATTQEQTTVPFDTIVAVDDDNVRTVYKDVDELAESIKAEGGLITPLRLVRIPGGNQLRLLSGFRRYRALRQLRWGSKPVEAIVCEYPNDASVYVANLVENTARDDLHLADLAARLQLLEEHFQVSRDELSRRTGLSKKHIGNLIRADKNVCDDVKRVWKKKDVPFRLVTSLAVMPEEQQLKALQQWEDEREGEKQKGPKKRTKDKSNGDGSKADGGDDADPESGSELDPDTGNVWQRRAAIVEKIAELTADLAKLDEEGDQPVKREATKNKLAGLRWVSGAIQRL